MDHYVEAERLMGMAKTWREGEPTEHRLDLMREAVAAAQVHATLAQVRAARELIAVCTPPQRFGKEPS
jgi:hypothetical protein